MSIGLLMLVLAFLGGLSFVVIYQLTQRWWVTDIGRNAFLFATFETALLGLSLAVVLFGDFPGRRWVAFGLFAAFTAVTWWRVAVLVRLVLATRRRDDISCPVRRCRSWARRRQ